MNKDSINEYLVEEGFRPEIDEDGDIKFKREGKIYYIQTNDSDDEFLRIIAFNIWSLDTVQEKRIALRLANKATRNFKVAKVIVSAANNAWATVELLVRDMESFTAFFYRSMSVLDEAVLEFRTDMHRAMQKIQKREKLKSGSELTMVDEAQ
jgi:hypothetical protein